MLFNSLQYALFLPVVFLLYWFVFNKKLSTQNLFLLACSYFFYACWDWRFLFLLIFSTWLDYYTGIKMSDSPNKTRKKTWLWISIVINLGFLGVFKYYNFFVDSFSTVLSTMGLQVNPWTLSVILPVGISFYTFHGLSYVLDIYYDRIKAEKNIVDYSLFVSFFPLLVAGPIERATHLLPQIKKQRTFDYSKSVDGLKQILWGLFKKIVIADLSANYVNAIFDNVNGYQGPALILALILFAFQIYGDFSGYSDIAIGTAKLLGIDLLRNFAFPFFSRDIAEFWRRWHMSLSSWFRDYLYIPLGGSRGSAWLRVRNIFIVFLVSGLWHGANWTFLFWGFLHAVYFLPLLLTQRNRVNLDIVAGTRLLPSLKETMQMIGTFGLTTFAWIFFRSPDLSQSFLYVQQMFSGIIESGSYWSTLGLVQEHLGMKFPLLLAGFIVVEWLGRRQEYAIADFGFQWKRHYRLAFYYSLIVMIIVFSGKNQQFIYFQF